MKPKLESWHRQEQQQAEVDWRQWLGLQSQRFWHGAVALGEALHGYLRQILYDVFQALHRRRQTMAKPQERFDLPDGESRDAWDSGDAERDLPELAGGKGETQASGDAILQVIENATYQDVLDAPDNKVAELINETLYLMSKPARPHVEAASMLGGLLIYPFRLGIGGPGGWYIYDEPELHLIRDIKVFVPDLAGWKLETSPVLPEDQRFITMPQWVCEVLSPSTRRKDLEIKVPEYGRAGVGHLWIVDPAARTLEAFESQAGEWMQIASLKDGDPVCTPPFEAITFDLGHLWRL